MNQSYRLLAKRVLEDGEIRMGMKDQFRGGYVFLQIWPDGDVTVVDITKSELNVLLESWQEVT